MFRLAVLQLFIWCEVLVGLLCLSAVVAGSDQEHCFVPAPSDEDTDPCPPWFIPQEIAGDNAIVECVCGPQTNGIVCNPKTCNASILFQYCITYNPVKRAQAVGICFFESKSEFKTMLPSNVSELNDFMCGYFNRGSQLCGACKKGYGPVLLTYDLQCAKCSSQNYGWALYLLVGFLPITLFYLVIVMFQVSATSGPLNAFIFSAQIVTTAIENNKLAFTTHAYQLWSVRDTWKIFITFYGIWNLDFFRSTIPPFCVSENITTLHAVALQYLPAFYPLLLIVVTYVLIELHDRNIRVVVWMWRPFHRCLAPFRKHSRWDPKASIISTFITFLTLAYTKLIIISGKILSEVSVTDIQGNVSRFVLLDPTVPYFGNEHLPFAILAIAVLSMFIALPLLLLLIYPTKTFQKLLGCLNIRWPALHIFADVFQGCYKNRTDGTNDYRCFAAFYFIARIVIFVIFVACVEVNSLELVMSTVVFIIGSLLFALLRPYKKNWLNVLDSLILASLGLASLWMIYSTMSQWIQLAGLIATLPLIYFLTYVAFRLLLWFRILQKCQQTSRNFCWYIQQRWKSNCFRQQELCDEGQIPDRMVNPCEYQPLPETSR